MDALAIAIIFEVSLLQMQIVEGCALLHATHTSDENNQALQLLRAKLHCDRNLLNSVLRATIVQLIEDCGWRPLREAVQSLVRKTEEMANLRIQNGQLRIQRSTLSHELKMKRRDFKTELSKADGEITILQDKKEDDILNAKIRLVYADKWLNAQSELIELRHQLPRNAVPSPGHENRVHSELTRAYDLEIKTREESTEYWRKKYSDDTAEMNKRLAEKREQFHRAVARRKELQELFNLHAGEMRAWLTFKKERAARIARETRNRLAATSIQAWWRGVMVRRGLGAFKHLKNARKSPVRSKKKS